MRLITKAYGLLPDQVIGPNWLIVDRYSVDAIVPPHATKQGFAGMLQNLLAQRFGLRTTSDQRAFSVYRLVIAKDGSKLRRSPATSPHQEGTEEASEDPPVQTGVDKNGCPQLAPGSRGAIGNIGGENCMAYRRSSMPLFVERLALIAAMETGAYYLVPSPLHIIDETGLRGEFDFELKYALPFHPPVSTPSLTAEPRASIFQAIEIQLGLKLVGSKVRLPVLVVKQASRIPSGN